MSPVMGIGPIRPYAAVAMGDALQVPGGPDWTFNITHAAHNLVDSWLGK
jgi:hypothetical protein